MELPVDENTFYKFVIKYFLSAYENGKNLSKFLPPTIFKEKYIPIPNFQKCAQFSD